MKKYVKVKGLLVLATCFMLSTTQLVEANETTSTTENNQTTSTTELKTLESSGTDLTETTTSSVENQTTANEEEKTTASSVENQTAPNEDKETTTNTPNDKSEEDYQKFVTVTREDAPIYSNDSSNTIVMDAKDSYGKTFQSKKRYTYDDGTVYLLLSNGNGKEVGLINEAAITIANGRQGVYQKYEKYVTVTNGWYTTYNNFSWNEKSTTKNMNGKTYFAKRKYEHINGMTYLSLFDDNGNWYGYVNAAAVTVADGRQGIYQSYGKYVTVVNNGYTTYSNFSWEKRGATKNMYEKTYLARGKYQHINGLTYLSLFDDDGKWCGYVNKKATKAGNGRQGAYLNYGKYVTVTKKGYSTYNNFSWSKNNSTTNIYQKTYQARAKYKHINGLTYLSLFDGDGHWYGYVNEAAVTVGNGRQGAYQNYGKYVTVVNDSYTTYNNFTWNVRSSTKDKFKKTYEARGRYRHIDGDTYLSLFDSKGGWYGYVNETATQVAEGRQGIYQPLNEYIVVTSGNYDMYNSFKWSVRQRSSAVYNRGLIVKGEYKHMNGSTYYSLYDGANKWQGYVNKNATRIVNYKVNDATYYSQMAIGAYNGCAATALYTALRAKGYAQGVSLISFINGLPLSDNNPDVGQIGNTWGTTPFRQVISPIGLNNYARGYTSNTEVITGSSIDTVINEINSGNHVLYWGIYLMRNPGVRETPQHVMIARGYKIGDDGNEYILIQDSGCYSSDSPYAVRWYEKNAFDAYLSDKYRKMMVVR